MLLEYKINREWHSLTYWTNRTPCFAYRFVYLDHTGQLKWTAVEGVALDNPSESLWRPFDFSSTGYVPEAFVD